MCFIFFFYCDADSPALHSFPTRRSSDLPGIRSVRSEDGGIILQMAEPHVVLPALLDRLRDNGHELADRKSTRLNSSHLGISYAVFCLKKKNNQHNGQKKSKHNH